MRNLKIVPATASYRPLSYEFKALFLAITTVQMLDEEAVKIPLHGFQFEVSAVIETRLNDNTILSGTYIFNFTDAYYTTLENI